MAIYFTLRLYFHLTLACENKLACSVKYFAISHSDSCNKYYIIYIFYSPLPERPRLSLRTINLIQSGMPVRKCISGEKFDIVLSNHNYGRRQIKAKWDNEEFGYFNTITKIANAILRSLFMFWL